MHERDWCPARERGYTKFVTLRYSSTKLPQNLPEQECMPKSVEVLRSDERDCVEAPRAGKCILAALQNDRSFLHQNGDRILILWELREVRKLRYILSSFSQKIFRHKDITSKSKERNWYRFCGESKKNWINTFFPKRLSPVCPRIPIK